MIITVEHVIIFGHGIDQIVQFLPGILREIVLQKVAPVEAYGFHVRHSTRFYLGGVDQLEQFNAHLRQFIH